MHRGNRLSRPSAASPRTASILLRRQRGRVSETAHRAGAPVRYTVALQLAHAGRKSSSIPWDGGKLIAPGRLWMPIAPSPYRLPLQRRAGINAGRPSRCARLSCTRPAPVRLVSTPSNCTRARYMLLISVPAGQPRGDATVARSVASFFRWKYSQQCSRSGPVQAPSILISASD